MIDSLCVAWARSAVPGGVRIRNQRHPSAPYSEEVQKNEGAPARCCEHRAGAESPSDITRRRPWKSLSVGTANPCRAGVNVCDGCSDPCGPPYCAAPPQYGRNSVFRPRSERSRPLETTSVETGTARRGVGEARAGEDPFTLLKSVSEAGAWRVPRPREPHPSGRDWCVDDDGVRGVRPYLFYPPKVEEALLRGEGSRGPEGEFDELAGLVRTWLSLAS